MAGYKLQGKSADGRLMDIPLAAQSIVRRALTGSDDLNNVVDEGHYFWTNSRPNNAPPFSNAVVVVVWSGTQDGVRQIIIRQGGVSNSNGQYTSDEIWMRSRVGSTGAYSWTDWALIPTGRYLENNYVRKTAFDLQGDVLYITLNS